MPKIPIRAFFPYFMSALAEIKFDCPECGEGLAIDRRAIGHQVACPFCKDPITVPKIALPAQIPLEPLHGRPGAGEPATPSLEELASSRPELPALGANGELGGTSTGAAAAPARKSKGGLPAKRKPGEKPKMLEGRQQPAGPVAPPMPPPGRAAPPVPPVTGNTRAARPPGAATGASAEERPSQVAPASAEAPEGFEQRVRRKRKRRNPDEHRLNPREHPTMVAFDEAVGENTFRRHPGHGKLPVWKKLGVIGVILGILAAIGLGVLKQMQLRQPDPRTEPRVLTPIEEEFETAKARLDAFRTANSVREKMSYVRVPITTIEGYPPLIERMNAYYSKYTLRPHFPTLDRASATVIKRGETVGQVSGELFNSDGGIPEFLRIDMTNNMGPANTSIESHVYFEKAVAGYALDWDSFVGYNPLSLTEFLVDPGKESDSGVFRLIVTPIDHYRGMYQNEEQYRSYMVTDMTAASRAVAYAVRGTPDEERIEAEFEKLRLRDKKRVLIIAKINLVERGVDGSYHVQIEKLLRIGWLLP